MSGDDLDDALRRAREDPDDASAAIAAAYACERAGDPQRALGYYEAAWALGVPGAERRDLLIRYASTLRSVGRAEDAVVLLGEALAGDDQAPAPKTFLGLALFEAGHPRAAMGTMVDVILDLNARSGQLGEHERAIDIERQQLLDAEIG